MNYSNIQIKTKTKLTKFVRKLMKDESYHSAYSEREALRNGRTKSKAVGKVMDGIAKDDHPS